MSQTLIHSDGIANSAIIRTKLNTTTAASAVIARVIAGTNISLTSTGVDSGTGDVTINATGAGAVGANPTAVVGLTAVNGSATTFLRSDGAPAIDQNIGPTWTNAHTYSGLTSGQAINVSVSGTASCIICSTSGTGQLVNWVNTSVGNGNNVVGNYTNNTDADYQVRISQVGATNKYAQVGPSVAVDLFFVTNNTQRLKIGSAGALIISAPTSGVALTVTGVSTQYAQVIQGASGSNNSWGLRINAGTTFGDYPLAIYDQTGTNLLLNVYGLGGMIINAPTAGYICLQLTGSANQYGLVFNASPVTGQSLGMYIAAGTNSSDFACTIQDSTSATDFFTIAGNGGVRLGAPTGGGKGLGTINVASGLYVNGVLQSGNPDPLTVSMCGAI